MIELEESGFILMVAPMQGFTEAPYRHFHAAVYGPGDRYFTPFVRLEHGAPRARDIRDITSPLNAGVDVTPQVIFNGADEFRTLAECLVAEGAHRIDLNLGCPFPLQTRKGRGAALVGNQEALRGVADVMAGMPEVSFSVKMRLGFSDPGEWRRSIDIINVMPLTHVVLHPRIASQQYGGPLYEDDFKAFAGECAHPVVYNGDIACPADIAALRDRCPGLAGVMAGRGLLARPSIFAEYEAGEEWDAARRLDALLRLHRGVYAHYASTLCGESQILSKIKPFWEYPEAEIGHKASKAIRKAVSLSKYEAAVSRL